MPAASPTPGGAVALMRRPPDGSPGPAAFRGTGRKDALPRQASLRPPSGRRTLHRTISQGQTGATARPVTGEIIPAHRPRLRRFAAICGIAATVVAYWSCMRMTCPF
ncbi:UNVERIFIED_ORG: hypothetical protein CLV66_103254 [Actinomadura viridilutea]